MVVARGDLVSRSEPDSLAAQQPSRVWLEGRSSRGPSAGLESITALLAGLGSPQEGLSVLQVGGTNGKGSVATYAAALLTAQGSRTGLYLSPHLQRLNERFVIDGREVDDHALDQALGRAIAAVDRLDAQGIHPSYFDVTTAVALVLFSHAQVQWAVLEVGLGGRLDSTSAVRPQVATVTSIDLDHTALLGDTLGSIAAEKGAIFRRAHVAVCGESRPVLVRQLHGCAPTARWREVPRRALRRVQIDGDRWRATGVLEDGTGRVIEVPCPSSMALRNGAIALVCVEEALQRPVDPAPLATVPVRGRLERIRATPPVIIDGAHNPAAMTNLVRTLRPLLEGMPVQVVFGAMGDKDLPGLVAPLRSLAASWHLASPAVRRAASTRSISQTLGVLGDAAPRLEHDSVAAAMGAAHALAREGAGAVVACGSFYLAGEALAAPLEAPGPTLKKPSTT